MVTTRSAFATIQSRAANSTSARPSNPIDAQIGCASRALAAIAATSPAPSAGTVAIVSPVAGFSTGIPVSVAASVTGPDIATASLVNRRTAG